MKRLILIALALGLATMLVACGGSSSSGLTGKTWHLTAITEKVPAFQGVIPAADQSKYAITFNADGNFARQPTATRSARTRRRAPTGSRSPRVRRRWRSAARPRSERSSSRA